MINYRLPEQIEIENQKFDINCRGDYRMILDVISVMGDAELTDNEKIYCEMNIFYNFNIPENQETAFAEMNRFINCGVVDDAKEGQAKTPIMSWEKDFPIICDDINAKYGIDIRGVEHLHWWTFVSYYKNLGEGQFSTIVSIRQKKKKGKKLEKWEQEFYAENRDLVNLDVSALNEEEQKFIDDLFGS